jgi:hypothetical protein
MQLNPVIAGANTADYPDAMSVVVTGGDAETRLAVKNVIFNALEGAKFRELNYIPEDIPYQLGDDAMELSEPVEDSRSLLEMCAQANPLFFFTDITIESAPTLLVPDNPVNAQAWDRITTHSSPGSKIKMEVGKDGGLVIHF